MKTLPSIPNTAWIVYIIKTESGKLYTGITNNLERRFNAHLKKKTGAKFFRISTPDCIVYQEQHPNRSEASKREFLIKKMNRIQKISLINPSCKNELNK